LTDKEPTPQWLVNIGGIVRKKLRALHRDLELRQTCFPKAI
jgi:hypothetical protein